MIWSFIGIFFSFKWLHCLGEGEKWQFSVAANDYFPPKEGRKWFFHNLIILIINNIFSNRKKDWNVYIFLSGEIMKIFKVYVGLTHIPHKIMLGIICRWANTQITGKSPDTHSYHQGGSDRGKGGFFSPPPMASWKNLNYVPSWEKILKCWKNFDKKRIILSCELK